tara:strand:+ start:4238 stop:4510 length:273 start_codon:yes stop_codon:yes gene_type:complete
MAHEIVKHQDICGGKSCIKGTRIRVIDIVERYKIIKELPEDIASVFDIPLDAVFSAISYYYQHPKEIRYEIEQDKELVKKMRSEMVAYAG